MIHATNQLRNKFTVHIVGRAVHTREKKKKFVHLTTTMYYMYVYTITVKI